jgi:CelD/BcsL family acetyltransferase involved in cellulose biosynthesis
MQTTASSLAHLSTIGRTAGEGAAACEAIFLTLNQWQAFVDSYPAGTAFHHRRWIELIVQQYGGECIIPAVRRGGRIATAVPFIETRSLTGKRKLISLPYSDCVPVLSEHDDPAHDLRLCIEPLLRRSYHSVVIRSDRELAGAASASDCVRHTIDMGRALAEVRGRYDKSLRRNLRKAESLGLRFTRRTDPAAMEVFYQLHAMTRRKLGVPVQPKRFFVRLHEMIVAGGLGFVALVEHERRPIAAGVFLLFKQTMIYKYGASDPAALEHRPNEFLMDHAIGLAAEEGCTQFDFGITANRNEGLRRFKRKWGAVETVAYHVYLAGEPRPRAEDSRLLKAASFVIRRSPPVVCRLLGEAFYRFSQ